MELRYKPNRSVAQLDDAEFPLEWQQVALGVVLQAGLVAVQDGEFDEFELVLEFVFFDDLVEEFGDVRGRIAEGAAAQRGEHQRIVEIGHSQAEDGAHLLQRDLCLPREHLSVGVDAGAVERRDGDDRDVVGLLIEL